MSRNLVANQERLFWEINQSYCEKVIDNAYSLCHDFGHTLKRNTFFGVEYRGKKQIESGSALSVLLSTTIFAITVVKICCGLNLLRLVSPQHFDNTIQYILN